MIAAIVTLSFLLEHAAAQTLASSGGTNRSLWLSYFGDQPFTKRWALHLEGSYRRTLGLSQFEQLELRPGITFVQNKIFQSLVAYTFFRSGTTNGGAFGEYPLLPRQIENRLFEQQQITHKLFGRDNASVEMLHRFRLEQRWQNTAVADKGNTGQVFSQRARYRLTVNLPLGRMGTPKYYLTAYNEVYSNTTLKKSSLLNQDVTYSALDSRLGSHWAVEVGYQFRYAPNPIGITGTEGHSVQIYLLSTAPLRHHRSQS